MFPSKDLSHAENAGRLAPFATAGYYDDVVAHAAQRHGFTKKIEANDGLIWYEKRANAHVAIAIHGADVFIGIGGTNDGKDLRHDFDVQPMRFGALSELHNLPVAPDANDCLTTRGFATHATLVYRAITIWAEREGFESWEFDNTWITGHSLGGAVAYLLQFLMPFDKATAYTFGGARCLRNDSPDPSRLRTRIIDIADSVIYQPAVICRHPSARKMYISSNGSLTQSIPKRYYTLYAVMVAALWSLGVIGSVASLAKIPWPWVMFRGHSMARYAKRMETWA